MLVSASTTFIEDESEESRDLLHPIRLKDLLSDRSVVDTGTVTVVGPKAGG